MDFMTNLILTALVYLLIPTILYLDAKGSGRQYGLSTIKKIVIINGACGWLFWRIIEIEMVGEVSSGVAVVLWSWIAYKILKKCELKEEPHKDEEQNNSCDDVDKTDIDKDNVDTKYSLSREDEEPISFRPGDAMSETAFVPPQNEQNVKMSLSLEGEAPTKHGDFTISGDDVRLDKDQDEKAPFTETVNTETTPKAIDKGKKGKHKVIIAILSILLVISIVMNIRQRQIYDVGLSFLEWRVERDEERLEFYDENIVLVNDDGTDRYHKYDCYKFGDYDFWAFNVEFAESHGYEPCPDCCQD